MTPEEWEEWEGEQCRATSEEFAWWIVHRQQEEIKRLKASCGSK